MKDKLNSKSFIEVSCKECDSKWLKNKHDVKRWKSGLCNKCSSLKALNNVMVFKKEDHPKWVKPIACIDCKKEIKVLGKRRGCQKKCSDCYQKSRNKSYCKKCKKQLRSNKSKHCFECFQLIRETGRNMPVCSICGNDLSTYHGRLKKNTGLCHKCYRGENTRVWNKELTKEEREVKRTKQPLYYEWRLKIFERDKYSCQKCKDNTGGNLCSHHIDNWINNKDLRFDVNNGITLCSRCHIGFHKTYGWKNNDVIQLMEFIDVEIKITA